MSKKMLVTKEFHQKAMKAISFYELHHDNKDMELIDKMRSAWINYMQCCMTEEDIENFAKYCEDFIKEVYDE